MVDSYYSLGKCILNYNILLAATLYFIFIFSLTSLLFLKYICGFIIGGMNEALQQLGKQLQGDLFYDTVMRTLYATDASAYREMPLAVAIPKNINDLKKLIAFVALFISKGIAPKPSQLSWRDLKDNIFSIHSFLSSLFL